MGFFSQVKHGHSKLVWCSLVGKVFSYYRIQEDKVRQLKLAFHSVISGTVPITRGVSTS